ncbi:helix-turn-helix transcriptional regulator [Lagierella sp. ICN-221743]
MNKLKAKRLLKQMYQQDLAKELDIQGATMCEIENGNLTISREMKEKICEILDIDESEEKEIFLPTRFIVHEQ